MLRRSALAVLLVALVSLSVTAPAAASQPRSKAERVFLADMVGHHAMAVAMAEMALERAAHPELKALATEMIESQTAEIDDMRTWLRRWYGRTVGPGHGGHDMADMEELEGAATPAEFEVRFMALMTTHHTQAVERATAVLQRRIHAKTRRLARAVVEAQAREIAQMREWLVAWYAN